jgi:hypothetical protein
MPQVDELEAGGKNDVHEAGSESSKVTFSHEQQAKVQGLIDDAYRKAYAKAQRSRTSSEEVERLAGEVERLREDKKTALLYRAISRHNVVDAEEVTKLIGDRVRVDEDGNVTVVNGSGSAKINGGGHPMGIDEYLADWLGTRPHHLRSAGSAGAGSQRAGFGLNGKFNFNLSDPSVWRSMPREDLDRYLAEGVNVYGSSGQVYKFRDVKNPFLEARKRRFQSRGDSNR